MSIMDKFLNTLRLNDDEDDYVDEDYLDDEPEPIPQITKRRVREREEREDAYEERQLPARKPQPVANKVTQIRQPVAKRAQGGSGMEVCVIKPTSIEDAREITETLLANRTVVLNLEGLDSDVAQRILDFTSGSCFAISGNLQKISMNIFIITPASVYISGDVQNLFGGAVDSPLNADL